MENYMESISRHVVKVGSSLVTNEDGIDQDAINGYVNGWVNTFSDQHLVVVVSGATVSGEKRYHDLNPDTGLKDQLYAAIGSHLVFNAVANAFLDHEIIPATVSLTHHQIAGGSLWQKFVNRREKSTFNEFVDECGYNDVPIIINETDAVSVIELMRLATGGDNDGLAAHVAIGTKADDLTLYKKEGGIYDESGNLINAVDSKNYRQVRKMVKNRSISCNGRGGALTAVQSCRKASKAGVRSRIARPNYDMTGDKVTSFMVG